MPVARPAPVTASGPLSPLGRALAAAMVAGLLVGEWLRLPTWWTAGLAAVAALGAAVPSWRLARPASRVLAGLLVLLGIVVAVTGWRLDGVERRWGAERRARIDRAFEPLQRELKAAGRLAVALAEQGLATADRPVPQAFGDLARLIRPGGAEHGVVVLDAGGRPRAWAGAQRLTPELVGEPLRIRATPFAYVLEARRIDVRGRQAIGTVLLSANPAVAGADQSLAEEFRRREGLGLTFYPPGLAPASSAIFDWVEPTVGGSRLLLSVRPQPPEQSEARQRVLGGGARAAVLLLLGVIAVGLSLVRSAPARGALLLALVWLPLRAPVGRTLGLDMLFAPTAFFVEWGGPFTSSAGALLLAGMVLVVVGLWLLERPLVVPAPVRMAAMVLAAAMPWLLLGLGRGITLPAEGATVATWLTWQLALAAAAVGPLLVLAALARAPAEPRPARLAGAVLLVLVAASAVAFSWTPAGGLPPVLLAAAGAGTALALGSRRRLVTVLCITLAGGAWASAVTWQEEARDRVGAAERDVATLRSPTDPLAYGELETFADAILAEPAPVGGAQLYALWRASSLRQQQHYPAVLGLWRPDGTLRQRLALDSLQVPLGAVASLVRRLVPNAPRAVATLLGPDGAHPLLLTRLATGEILTVLVGPRSRLIPPTRLGVLLDPGARAGPEYALALAPSTGVRLAADSALVWSREGWRLTARAPFSLGLRPSDIVARVDLRGPLALGLRGVAVLALDLALALLLLFLADRVGGRPLAPLALRTAMRGFRARLGLALAAFVLVPIIATAVWSYTRLDDETLRARDLVLSVLLREAAARGEPMARDVEADPAYYRDAVLDSATAPLFHELGLLDALVPPAAYQALALRGQPEATAIVGSAAVGFREASAPADPGRQILAVPMPLADPALTRSQLDLVLGVLVAALAGAIAALAGAAWASRLLARPVADLRRAALAIGRGSEVPARSGPVPSEFEPVFGAFARMVEDLQAGRTALETAQARLAATLATVATGVIALDGEGLVLMANPQAEAVLGQPVPAGQPFGAGLDAGWQELVQLVAQARRRVERLPEPRELVIGERRVLATLTRLAGGEGLGLVLALNDVTELSRAERVLAWGEMAQQVAHEIKNPLTPMRLGVQHLQRAWRDRRESFDGVLDETGRRILEEIDRLDGVARAFSRFAAPAPVPGPLEPIDVAAVARDVVQLYRLAGDAAEVRLEADGPVRAPARPDELKEVLVNLLENARGAGARRIIVRAAPGWVEVEDDGRGIPAANLPRIFEPRFSTNTSGSGLGLAIVQRLVDGWNARVTVESAEGVGTTVRVTFEERPDAA